MQVLIISGGSIDTKYALAFLSKREYDYVIAVDKGALFCWENGIRPDLLTGDFDTLSSEILKKWEAQGVPVRRFRRRRMMRILRSHCRRQENFWMQESSRGQRMHRQKHPCLMWMEMQQII